MKKIILVILMAAWMLPVFGQWTVVSSGTTTQLNSVFFTDVNTGYVVGNSGLIKKTIDGGITWTTKPSGTTSMLTSVFFIDANNGYAVSDNGDILRTINAGTNWTLQTVGTSNRFYSICFTDSDTGYVVGASGAVFKTIDAGSNWTPQTSGTGVYLNSVYFTDNNTGYAVGQNGTIIKTVNGGTTWTLQSNLITEMLNSVFFYDANNGYAVGGGTVLKTTDGGISWNASMITDPMIGLQSVVISDVNIGYTTSGNLFFKTTNGGTTWFTGDMGSIESKSLFFTNVNTGYAVGSNGTILKTTNGGTAPTPPIILCNTGNTTIIQNSTFGPLNFQISDINSPPSTLTISQKSSNQSLIPDSVIQISGTGTNRTLTITPKTGQSGSSLITLAVTDADGLADTARFTLTVVAPVDITIPSIYKIKLPDNFPDSKIYVTLEKSNRVWVFGTNGLVAKSNDLTMTGWTLCNSGIAPLDTIYAADSFDGNTWVIGTTNGHVYRSTDGGASWSSTYSNPGICKWINLVKAHSSDSWLIGSDPGSLNSDYKILLSNDAGISWSVNSLTDYSGTSNPWQSISPSSNRVIMSCQIYCNWGTRRGFFDYPDITTSSSGIFRSIGNDSLNFAQSIQFKDNQTGLAYKDSSKTLWKTLDGGNSWNIVAEYITTGYYYAMAMAPDNGLAYLVGKNGKIIIADYLTNSFKESTTIFPSNDNAKSLRIHASPNNKFYFCGSEENKIFYCNSSPFLAPVIGAVNDTIINANTKLQRYLQISGNAVNSNTLTLTTHSSNQALIPDSSISIIGQSLLNVSPKANSFGSASIQVIATNVSNLSDTCSFNLTVNRTDWTIVTSNTSEQLNSIHFIDANTGYACGNNGVIMKSIDGGKNWTTQISDTTANLNSIFFTSPDSGYIAGNGIILATDNAGSQWVPFSGIGTTNNLTSIFFTDQFTAYAVGQNGTIIKNPGNGLWTTLTSGTSNYLRSVYFVNDSTGYAAGLSGTILKTTNGGTTWSVQASGVTATLRSIFFADEQIGYIAGTGGTILKTTDGGTTWTKQTSNTTNPLYAVTFINPLCGIAAGQNLILKTNDGGTNWIAQTGLSDNTIYSLGQSSISSIYAAGTFGTILNCLAPFNKSKPTLAIFQNPVLNGYLHIAANINQYGGLPITVSVDATPLTMDTLATDSWLAHYPLHITGSHTITLNAGDTTITRTFTAARTGKSGGSFSCNNGDFSVSYPENTEEYTLAAYLEGKDYIVGNCDFKTTKNLTVRWKTKENKAIYCNGGELATYRDGDYLVTRNGKFGKFSLGEAILNSMTTELYGNYPNPFNPITSIRFAISMEDAGSLAQLKIYNIKGELVETLLNNQLAAGKHIINWNAARYASGVYYYTLKAGSKIQTAKMLMVK